VSRHTWVELCAGSCSMSAHLLGWTMQPTTWLGAKWRYRDHLTQIARGYGLVGSPHCIAYDAGPIAEIAPQLIRSARARELAVELAGRVLGPLALGNSREAGALSKVAEVRGPFRERCEALQGPPPDDPDERAAHGAVMIGASFGGKGLAERGGRWVLKNGIGRCPLGLRAVRSRARMPTRPIVSRRLANAMPHDLPSHVHPSDCVVLLDPPYDRRAGYQHDMPREAVVALAQSWRMAGAAVIITEAEPVMGWSTEPLQGHRTASRLGIAEIVEHAG